MVTRYGMSEEVGPVRLQVKAGEGFLGDDSALVGLSPQTQRDVEDAVRRLITAAQDEATGLLRAHRAELDALAERLDAEETLEDEVLQQALAPLMASIASAAAPRQHGRAVVKAGVVKAGVVKATVGATRAPRTRVTTRS